MIRKNTHSTYPHKSKSSLLPEWAPRIKPYKIQRLYLLDSQGIYDEELITDIGFALRSRCQSFIEANQAVSGNAPCASCSQLIPHNLDKGEILHCDSCGWELSWGDYFATIQHKQLSGANPVINLFQEFVELFPKARTTQEKMFLIDRLLHGFHYNLKYGHTRPVSVNLIQGKLSEVISFLDQLSYSQESTDGLNANRDQWVENSANSRSWAFKGRPNSKLSPK
jgi:hypothetical protein